jgi:poly-gamma-glutamate synthesis protein (capsule biosynthesis protein)
VTTKWEGGKFVEAQLHPITLGFQTPRSVRGRPRLASGADATRILDMLTTRSKTFGATVTVRNGVGIVTP